MTPAMFRREALALPGAVEGQHHGHPDFRAHGRVFASLHPNGEQGCLIVPVPVQQRLLAAEPGACTPAAGAWGRAGGTMVRLADAPIALVRDGLAEAWQFAAAKGAKKAAPKKPAPKPKRPRA